MTTYGSVRTAVLGEELSVARRYLRLVFPVTAWGAVLGFRAQPSGSFSLGPPFLPLLTVIAAPFVLAGLAAYHDERDALPMAIVTIVVLAVWSLVRRVIVDPTVPTSEGQFLLMLPPAVGLLSALAAYHGAGAIASWALAVAPSVAFSVTAGQRFGAVFGADPGMLVIAGGATVLGVVGFAGGAGLRWAVTEEDTG